jgi:hypothetical protein
LSKRIRDQILVQRVAPQGRLRISVTEEGDRRSTSTPTAAKSNRPHVQARHVLFFPGRREDGWAAARRGRAGLRAGEGRTSRRFKGVLGGSLGKDGGSLGTLKRGELTAEIEQAILRLQPGESSPPTRSAVGYHLFHLDAKGTLSG